MLTTLGATATTPQVAGDPAVARAEFLDSTTRTVGVLGAALADLVPLRDEAPNSQVKTAFSLVVDEFTAARRSSVDAQRPRTR